MVVVLEGKWDIRDEFNGNVSFESLEYRPQVIFGSIRKIRRMVKVFKPDLIHSHLFDATILARLSKPAGIPLVSTIHSMYSLDAFQSKKALWIERLTIGRQNAIISVSKSIKDDYLQYIHTDKPFHTLSNFLPEKFFKTRQGEKNKDGILKCVAIGNLKKVKNYFFLMEAFKSITDKDIHLDIYGDGDLEEPLKNYILKHQLKVKLCGTRVDVQNALPFYDLFIQGSIHEGFGLAVIEAMAARLPVLLSDIEVFREITNGHAHFFDLSDPELLANKLKDLSADREKMQSMVPDAFRYVVENYTSEIYKDKLEAIYRSLLGTDRTHAISVKT